jgi:DNA (cytosine-5)-methyltransferase 1
VADTNGERSQRTEQFKTHRGETETQLSTTESFETEGNYWEFEPDVGRVAHGISGRVHRLKGLGNSIVPQIVEEIGKALIKGMKE